MGFLINYYYRTYYHIIVAERVGIEPTSPCIGRVDNGFEDRGDHQAPITLPNAKRRSAPVKSN